MPRTQISIKLDTELLDRVDELADAAGVTRTAVIEKAVQNDLPEQESFHRALENPVIRAIHEKLTRPAVLRAMAMLTNEDMSDEELAAIVERAPQQRAAAQRRRSARTGTRGSQKKRS